MVRLIGDVSFGNDPSISVIIISFIIITTKCSSIKRELRSVYLIERTAAELFIRI